MPTDISAQRKRKRGYRGNPAVPLAAFGAIVGTIGAIAAENRRREYYERPYYGPRAYGYYDAPPAYHRTIQRRCISIAAISVTTTAAGAARAASPAIAVRT